MRTAGRPLRHILLAMVLLGFLVSFGLGVQTLSGAGTIVRHLLDENTLWPATQAHSEMTQLESALTRLAWDPTPRHAGRAMERLDIVWSRLSVLEAGEVAAYLRDADLYRPVEDLRTLLTELEPLEDALGRGDAQAAAAADQALSIVLPGIAPLRAWSLDVLHANREDLMDHVRARSHAIWAVLISFSGLVVSGLIFMLLLTLEIRAGRRQTAAAEAARSTAAAAEQRLVDAIEAIPEGFALYDAEDRLVLSNQRYKEIYRASAPAIVPGAAFADIIRYGVERGQYAEAVGNEDAWIADRVQRHLTPSGPIEQRLKDRRWLRIEERRTSEGGVVGVRVDVTEIKRAQDLLSRAEQIADLGHFNLSVATGETVFSTHLYRILNLPADRPASVALLLSRVEDDDRPRLARGLDAACHEGQSLQGVFSSVPFDGESRWFEINLVPDTDAAGQLVEILGTVQDITAQKKAEDKLAAATAEAEAANAAKSQFLSIMSHEIRTPMNGVAGALNLVERHNLDSHDAEMIDLARRSADRLRTVLNDVLDFTRMESGRLDLEPVPFDPRAFLRETTLFWTANAKEKGLSLGWTVDVLVPERLVADTGRLRQIVDNLVSNAIKFTDRGRIDISMGLVRDPGASSATERQSMHLVRLAVADSGPGIAEADRPKVFADFSQLRAGGAVAQTGSGLGLAICRRLCTLMEGSIDFVSQPGRGTTFVVELPLRVADAATEVRRPLIGAPGETASAVPEGVRVLVAEDNPTNQVIIRHMLQRIGCTVDLAGNGQEAVDALAARPYDLVVMDVSMPVMDGVEAARQIRAHHGAEPPIIGYTAHAMMDDRQRFRDAGMDVVLAKPVNPDELAATLAMVMDQRGRSSGVARGVAAGVAAGVAVGSAPDGTGKVASAETFDRETLEMLESSLEPETYRQVVNQFRVDVAANLQALDTAFQSEDWGTMDRASHTLAGMSATLGAKALEAEARALNNLCRKGEGPAISAGRIATLRAAAERTLADTPQVADHGAADPPAAPQPGAAVPPHRAPNLPAA